MIIKLNFKTNFVENDTILILFPPLIIESSPVPNQGNPMKLSTTASFSIVVLRTDVNSPFNIAICGKYKSGVFYLRFVYVINPSDPIFINKFISNINSYQKSTNFKRLRGQF